MSDQRLLSTGDVARMLHVSDATVKRWSDSGALRCLRTVGTHRKFLQADVAALLASSHFVRPKAGAPVSRTQAEEALGHLIVGDTKWLHGALSGPADVAGDRLLPAFELLDSLTSPEHAAWRGEIAIDCLERVCAVKGSAQSQTGAGRMLCIWGCTFRARAMALLSGLVAREAGFAIFQLSWPHASDISDWGEFLKLDCIVSTIDVPEEAAALEAFRGTIISAGHASCAGHQASTLAEVKHLLSPTLRRGAKDGSDG